MSDLKIRNIGAETTYNVNNDTTDRGEGGKLLNLDGMGHVDLESEAGELGKPGPKLR